MYTMAKAITFQELRQAVDDLKNFFASHNNLNVVFDRTWSADELDELEVKYGVPLPPGYRFFMETYGPFHIEGLGSKYYMMVSPDMMWGVAPDVTEAAGGQYPENEDYLIDAISGALFFQYQSDEYVQDFYCFSKYVQREDSEMDVCRYYHDEFFKNEKLGPDADLSRIYTFEEFFCDLVKEIQKRCKED
jgi:hypothetical protein